MPLVLLTVFNIIYCVAFPYKYNDEGGPFHSLAGINNLAKSNKGPSHKAALYVEL